MPPRYELSVEGFFSSAHALRGYEGACEALHGHNWAVQAKVVSPTLDSIGLAVDFKVIQGALDQALAELDHRNLNELPAFAADNASAERVAQHVYGRLRGALKAPVRLQQVTVTEAPGCSVTYAED
jgi:6-pyruvoyltetrahydropterin/6-carboxytetrahydropterin synthase